MIRNAGEVWIADDDESIRWVLKKALTKSGYTVESFADGQTLFATLRRRIPSVVITDIRMPGKDGFELLREIVTNHPALPVIVMTAYADLDTAVSAYGGGAFEYLPKPFDLNEALSLVAKALRRHSEPDVATPPSKAQILGSAPAMQEVYRAIGRLSKSKMSVLITGESGTGKELVARALHEHSPRAHKRFVALNTAAIPRELLESELFGHERGAFTGAEARRIGRFEQADGGTLFLDEIGDMPAELQTRLLRVLSEGAYFRVGGRDLIDADVRVIAATHQPLESKVNDGSFRSDLYHRLNVIRIRLPAMRERKEDIEELLAHFLSIAAAELAVPTKRLSDDALASLQSFAWPGNVRQLENTCRWLTVMAPGDIVELQDLPAEVKHQEAYSSQSVDWQDALMIWLDAELGRGRQSLLAELTPQFEAAVIRSAMRHANGKRQVAARLLGWGRNTLSRKIQSLNLADVGDD